MAKKQPKNKKSNTKIANAIVDFVTPTSFAETLLMASGPVGVGGKKLMQMASKSKMLKPVKALLGDLKIFKGQQSKYKGILNGRTPNQIKDSKYLTEKQNSLISVTSKVDELKKLTKSNGINFNKTNDYGVKKYAGGGIAGGVMHTGQHYLGEKLAHKGLSYGAKKVGTTMLGRGAGALLGSTFGAVATPMAAAYEGFKFMGTPEGEKVVNTQKTSDSIITKQGGTNSMRTWGGMGSKMQDGGAYQQMNQYQQGGQQLPGGEMEPIPGSDAVQFNGASHEQGGIELDPQTEVEGGETMDQVTMRDGGRKDYFFSSHLKHKGQPFSARHKQVLEMGGTQAEVDALAKVQERTAGRDEEDIASTEGKEQYNTGGKKNPFNNDTQRTDYYDNDHLNGLESQNTLLNQLNSDGGDAILPGYNSDGTLKGGSEYDKVSNNEFVNDEEDPNDIISRITSNLNTQRKEEVEKDIEKKKEIAAKTQAVVDEEDDDYNDADIQEDLDRITAEEEADKKKDGTEEVTEELDNINDGKGEDWRRRSGVDGLTVAAMAGQFLPAMRAMNEDPDYMSVHQAGAMSPAMSPELGRTHLKRVNMNVERERNAGDLRSMNKFIENSGMGPAGIANRMAAYGKKQQGDRQIAAQEAQINVGIANKEAAINQDSKKTNISNMMTNTQFNARQQNALNMFNEQQGARTDDFNRGADAATKDRRLMGLTSAMNTFAGINTDRLKYQAQERMAQAISGDSGVLTREEIARDLAKAHPDMGPESEDFQRLVENTYLKTLKNSTKQNKNG